METIVDLSGIANELFMVLSTALTAVIAWGVSLLSKRIGLDQNSALQKTVTDALTLGSNYAINYAKEKAGDKLTIDVKNEAIKKGADFVLDVVPEALEKFGIDREGVINRLESRWNIDLDGDGDIGLAA